MIKNKRLINIFIILIIVTSLLGVIGFTYSYFTLEIDGTGKDIVMSTGDLRLEYLDDIELKLEDAFPGDTVRKKIIVKNVGSKKVNYNFYWNKVINTIDNFELHVIMECKSYKNYGESNQEEVGTCDRIYRAVPYSDTIISKSLKKNIEIDAGITQEYNLTLRFDNKNYNQNSNLNKTFTGQISIEEYIEPEEVYCNFDGEMVQGAEFVKGQYTYRYKQQGYESADNPWTTIKNDGWGVMLTNKDSTDPVTDKVCTYINDKPVVSMAYMYYNSKATSVDLSKLNTKNVIYMNNMFRGVTIDNLDLTNFDTSNVIDMYRMFYKSNINEVNLSSFDTKNVTTGGFNGMFSNSSIKSIDLSSFELGSGLFQLNSLFSGSKVVSVDVSSFDTSNISNMDFLFASTMLEKLDVSNFDTSNVTSLRNMFSGTKIATLDLSNFNTTKVTNMTELFSNSSKLTSLDLSSFDTSNVTNLSSMFKGLQLNSLDLSNFNTSKVTDMAFMFEMSNLKEIRGLNKFNTSKVTTMDRMFHMCKTTNLDLSSFDTSNVVNMNGMFWRSSATKLDLSNFSLNSSVVLTDMFSESVATVGYAKDEASASKFNDSSVTKIPSTLKFVVK